jgi:hypothetical protein
VADAAASTEQNDHSLAEEHGDPLEENLDEDDHSAAPHGEER